MLGDTRGGAHAYKVQLDRPLARQTSLGLLFGLTALSCMTIRLHVAEWGIVDQRKTIIVLSTLLGGPLAGFLTVAMAAGLRLSLGGAGILGGLVGMALAFSAGFVLRSWTRERNVPFFLWGSLFATLVILPGFLLVGELANGWGLCRKWLCPCPIGHFLEVDHYLKAHRAPVDLVVTDRTMPRITGLDVANPLRQDQGAVPVILCTG